MTLTPTQLTALNQQLAADPTYQALVKQALQSGRGKSGALTGGAFTPLRDYVDRQYGVDLNAQQLAPNIQAGSGTLVDNSHPIGDAVDTYAPYVAGAIAGGEFAPALFGGAGTPAAPGGAVAADTSAASGAVAPTAAATAPDVLASSTPAWAGAGTSIAPDAGINIADAGAATGAATGASSPGFVAGNSGAFDSAGNWVPGSTATNPASFATAAATGTPLWKKLLTTAGVPQAVGGVVGSAIQANAANNATNAQVQIAQQALAWAKQQAALRQTQLAPTINIGNSAREQQAQLLGLNPTAPGDQWSTVPTAPATGTSSGSPSPTAPAITTTTTPTPLSAPTSPTAPAGMVVMRAPDGSLGYVPQSSTQQALAAGGRLV